MKLSYRGVSYEAEPDTLEVTEGEIGGLYRGRAWRVHNHQPIRRRYLASLELIYRGVGYKRQ
jgi:hypothetical protein